jgi:hypothetical protein
MADNKARLDKLLAIRRLLQSLGSVPTGLCYQKVEAEILDMEAIVQPHRPGDVPVDIKILQ